MASQDNNFEDTNRLGRLLSKMLDEQLGPDESNELVEILQRSEEAREFYLKYLHTHSDLASKWGLGESPYFKLPGIHDRPVPTAVTPPVGSFVYWMASCSVLLAIAFVWQWLSFEKRLETATTNRVADRANQANGTEEAESANEPTIVAVVEQLIGEAAADTHPIRVNDRLSPCRLEVAGGLVKLRFLSGASLIIEGPAELALLSEMNAEVRSGLVTADVPRVAQGFTLQASGWKAVDRGTVFGIDARSPNRAEVHVLEGRVDMHLNLDESGEKPSGSTSLTTGQAARLTASALVTQQAAVDRFLRTDQITDRAAKASQGQLEEWKRRRDILAGDPRLRFYLDFEDPDLDQAVIHNRAAGAPEKSDATAIGGEWTQGRWDGKSAFAFQRAGDLIRAFLGLELNDATFVASLRFESNTPEYQTILLTPAVGPGQIYWLLAGREHEIPNSGVAFIKTNNNSKDHRFSSFRPLSDAELGQWHTLALVHDLAHKRVRHYMDGTLVNELELTTKYAMNFRQLVIGNFGLRKAPRNFSGRIDEIAIFDEVLTADEIRELPISMQP